jgi:hypothetical protein
MCVCVYVCVLEEIRKGFGTYSIFFSWCVKSLSWGAIRVSDLVHVDTRGAKYAKIRGPVYPMHIKVCSIQGYSAEYADLVTYLGTLPDFRDHMY